MCGISGLVSVGGSRCQNELRSRIRKMGLSMFHRGPDAWGEYIQDGIALGHNRLSIIDIEGGTQPMVSSDGRYSIVFNGEIYNASQLRKELSNVGGQFRTSHSDTEVIVEGFRLWGEKVFSRLEGMFAIAIWDSEEASLTMCRDRFGIKPLYYCSTSGFMCFASEPKAILASGLIEPRIHEKRVGEYFLFRAPVSGALLEGVEKLDAGSVLKWRNGSVIQSYTYWSPGDAGPRATENQVELDLEAAVKSHVVSDVPIGVFLSGGVDSSLITALMAKQSGVDVDAYTIRVSGDLDEGPMADAVAKHLGIQLHTRQVDAQDMLDGLDSWSFFNDDPVADPSALPLMLLCEHARANGRKVMLAGEGADELFGGYNSYVRYSALKNIGQLTQFLSLDWFQRFLPVGGRTLDYLGSERAMSFLGTAHTSSLVERESILNSECTGGAREPYRLLDAVVQEFYSRGRPSDLRSAMLVDQSIRLPNDLLARTDRASMAWSLEARVPFLDRSVAETANRLSDRECLTVFPRSTKKLLKRVAARYVPEHVIYRPKCGFDLPLADWFRGSMRPLVESNLEKRALGFLNYSALRKFWDSHLRGDSVNMNVLWAWSMLEVWANRWIKSDQLQLQSPLQGDYNHDAYKMLLSHRNTGAAVAARQEI